ncbi:2-amino-4-hydroxy-6-hydroxymethyldihydropteridine diphosphokinase [Sulfobacillus harzensis]|uniref:2-amino-4-hydroxy-6-hydroxymethyldihydropteridine diphosphokinase n=1 Tax=Sulfobacillus harzensis TaxID=2729629 RepID=A0A7Y0Q1M1_9FIRM|nr:2-amino-4-hydroxy-6-hydroxymethyldihydropteridine diphosphokinase [Sulfobacillus harzensis]NMP21470.1 2-amino-4-hydroxy-6-hydroxymethyldihydropteridine diphosphokinase [Sulfobacillus harzensis]
MTVKAYVGMGSNWGDSAALLAAAEKAVALLGWGARTSSCYRTAPVGGPSQPPYLNAVMELETAWPPDELLRLLLRIEERFGRHRRVRWGPRYLDLDLILYDTWVIDTPNLRVPHPRMHDRRFVLEPLAELAPERVIPGKGTVRAALKGVLNQEVDQVDGCVFAYAGD